MARGIVTHVLGLITVLGVLQCVQAIWSDLEITAVEDMNGTASLPIMFGIRTKRIKKGSYGIAGIVTITDLFDGYDAEVKLYHSANGGNDWKLAPIKLPRGPLCEKVKDDYRKFLMEDLHPVSDLPYSEDKDAQLCAMFEKREFEVKNFIFDQSKIPKFLQAGLYKLHILIWKGAELTSGLDVSVSMT